MSIDSLVADQTRITELDITDDSSQSSGWFSKLTDYVTAGIKKVKKTAGAALVTLALASSLLSTSGCKQELYGTQILRETDGVISDEATQWIKTYGKVYSWTPELAELVNEGMAAERLRIPEKLSIDFEGSIGQHANGHSNATAAFQERIEIHGTNIKRFKGVYVLDGHDKHAVLSIVPHEILHYNQTKETIPRLTEIRIPVMLPLHFDKFGEETQYTTFRNGLLRLRTEVLAIQYGLSKDGKEYSRHMIAAALALNDSNGSFPQAHELLGLKRKEYFGRAIDFVNYSSGMPDVEDVVVHYPTEFVEVTPGVIQDVNRVELETRSHLKVSLESLLSIVSHQIIEEELRRVGKYSPEKAEELRGHARFRYFSQTEPTLLADWANSLFKPDFTHPMIYRPADYQDQIPKGE